MSRDSQKSALLVRGWNQARVRELITEARQANFGFRREGFSRPARMCFLRQFIDNKRRLRILLSE
jgi:hypothetical protein